MKKAAIAIVVLLAAVAIVYAGSDRRHVALEETQPHVAVQLTGAQVFYIPDVVFSGDIPCNGDYVEIPVTWQVILNQHFDSDGGFHYIEHWNIHGQALSMFGNLYRFNYADTFHINDQDGPPFNGTNVIHQVVVGKGSAPNLQYHATIHQTINANGVLTVDIVQEHFSCA